MKIQSELMEILGQENYDGQLDDTMQKAAEYIDELEQKNAELRKTKENLLNAVKAAYRKHHMGDDNIGWNELSTILHDAMCEEMGEGEE
jgi:glutamate/tyrosine decarboxylase-like PLP-dependent enzyme